MATGMDRLERNFDRLERFFKKRRSGPSRASVASSDRSSTCPSSRPESFDLSVQKFPSPSFIRPTSTRMLARDDVVPVSRPSRRAQSLPEAPSTPERRLSAETSPSTYSNILDQFPKIPQRSSSLPCDETFPGQTKRYPESLILKYSTTHGNPTPEPSPKLAPLQLRSILKTSQIIPASASTRPKSLDNHADGRPKITMSSLRKAISDSALSASVSPSKMDEDLKEPSLNDFMALSDDDIADDRPVTPERPIHLQEPSTPPTCCLPPNPPQPETPQSSSASESPLSMPHSIPQAPAPILSPPASRAPATVAAFEAARIATRYKFDLVYVVNLWPSNTGCSQPRALCSKASAPCHVTSIPSGQSLSTPMNSLRSLQALHTCLEGQGSVANINPPGGMNGRILAAFGLPSVLSPFRISAPVHQKVLRADGWLEYRSDTPASDEFARGYSCAFYTGYTPDGRWRPVETEVDRERTGSPEERTKKRSEKPPNRGIVFAAYRLPKDDGTTLSSDTAELESLHQDAELFVQTLVDIHMMQRHKDLGSEAHAAQLVRNNSTHWCAPGNQPSQTSAQASPATPILAV
ncbi:hypothetical protein GQ53DRAFT_806260 [Thozetella sp. PMI_491]|nr:hypothetical protein GQ53DRAFT_806260 [Thozetella sp. PMI_491]